MKDLAELSTDEDYASDPATAFGVTEAVMYRDRG